MEKHQLIIDATCDLIAENGLQATPISSVAKEAGCGAGTIYRYFETKEELIPDLSRKIWIDYLPKLDVWLNVKSNEVYYVNHIIPTLDWTDGLLGVRLVYEPKNIEILCKEFVQEYKDALSTKSLIDKNNPNTKLKLWPTSLRDFLKRKLKSYFTVKAYILNPAKLVKPLKGVAQLQKIAENAIPLEQDPFIGLMKIDLINAQRGFSDANTDNVEFSSKKKLSTQLKHYYEKHLDPLIKPEKSDLEALEAIDNAQTVFDSKLKDRFKSSIKELETLNYPGFGNPSITISSKVNPIDSLNHSSSVLFDVTKNKNSVSQPLHLPEKYNGLGYQNLISMIFKLISFRDEWMQVGKISNKPKANTQLEGFEPLHLVLVEEPEAHLHAQVQQVFIRKAFDVLRNHKTLKDNLRFSTQLVVSTHSNHIAHEVDFVKLRYFKRQNPNENNVIPTSTIVNLSNTFGNTDKTTKFAIRYLKTTHCDLFFADAVILVEGPAERILVPHFINQKSKSFSNLRSMYISLLEIGGSHAHTLKPLIEELGILTLIITDIDTTHPSNKRIPVIPEVGKGIITSNTTIRKWLPKKEKVDDLLASRKDEKISADGQIMVAYQTRIRVLDNKNKPVLVYPYTFEDSLVFTNKDLFKSYEDSSTGLMKKIVEAIKNNSIQEARKIIFDSLKKGNKAKFALDLLYLEDTNSLKIPAYIDKGLDWLEEKLSN